MRREKKKLARAPLSPGVATLLTPPFLTPTQTRIMHSPHHHPALAMALEALAVKDKLLAAAVVRAAAAEAALARGREGASV